MVATSRSLAPWLRVLRQVRALGGGRWRGLPGALLAWRDATPFVRLHFLAVATDLGLLEELRRRPATSNQLGARLAIDDLALLEAFLHLGATLGELRCRAGRWSLRGRRGNALAASQADTMRALVQEALRYDAAVYAGLDAHLRGAPPGDYLRTTGALIGRGVEAGRAGPGATAAVAGSRAAPAVGPGRRLRHRRLPGPRRRCRRAGA
jgi:hypothetical protein